MRRAAIKYRTVVKQVSNAQYAGKLHYHGCTRCHHKYFDGCHAPDDNDLCHDCRQGRPTFLQLGFKPKDCCQTRRPVSTEERNRYKLAGSDAWWICRACARHFTSAGSHA